MSSETCPFCGKSYKRLNSHLPHCKMSPGSKTGKLTNKTTEMQTTTFKHTSHMDKTNKANITSKINSPIFQGNSKSKPKEKLRIDKELLANTNTLTSTAPKVPSTSGMNTDTVKAKTKWLAKREQEVLKQAKLQTQTRIKFTSVLEKHNNETQKKAVKDTLLLEKETKMYTNSILSSQLTNNKINCTTTDSSRTVSEATVSQIKQNMPKCTENVNISEPLTKECTLGSRVKQQGVSVFQTKTCVWDHIKHGLYKSRYDGATLLFPIVSAHVSFTKCVNTSESELEPHTGNYQNTIMKTVQFPMFQTSVKRPVENVLSSRFQNTPVIAYSPEMATGYGGTCFISSHSEISNANLLMKCQTSKPSAQRQGPVAELRLEDVKLNELASYLVARTPKTPRDVASMFTKGWQWYYRKYIDVRKGGIGGIAMLIGGYCTLSYIWHYPHIKKHRWKKYH
ncbi:uncharacterized protein si:dkey-21c1.4 isoform X2 [Silurus meridionalis]|uniref:uncharacterized protein si:dkey-21c1.4 isoform X2 n=1 Tax=Silurus meridionalis TaxID=175797 RepID=UPI001EEBDEB9|nr:uncharacterized protein si:dkey-21c1.4 isoform X2 [Silurus meridionalis]